MIFKKKKEIKDYLTIEDLEKSRDKLKKITIKDKKNVRVLFLDDEGFDDDVLKSLGYLDISVKDKYEKLSDFENYDIIFCDINGIAKKVDEVYQGAAIAKLIKKTYPLKRVFIFSSKQQSLDFYKFTNDVDGMIPKNTKNSDLAEKIDECIGILNDPVESWKNLRKQLLEQGTSLASLTVLEDYYVRGILKNENTISLIEEEISKINIQSVVSIIGCAKEIIKAYLELKK